MRDIIINNNLLSTISEGVKIKGSIYVSGIVKIRGEVINDIKSEKEKYSL